MAKAKAKSAAKPPIAKPLLGNQLAAALAGKSFAIVGPPELRNPELEAAIAAAPDDAAGYLVYGDWLQERGDPRGTLIALQHAARTKQAEDPDSKAPRAAIAALLVDHDHALMGLVGQYDGGRDELVEIEWWLGFWRRATLRFGRRDRLEAALRELLAHPSACALQELLIDLPSGPGQVLEPRAIVEILLASPRPPLRRLQLGMPGAWTIPEAVHEVFPRLRQDDASVWAVVRDRLAGERALKVAFDATALPALIPRDPAAGIVAEPKVILSGLKAELDKGRDLGLVVAMRQVFTPESRDRFAHALVEQWFAGGERPADRWAFETVGILGGERCAAFLGARLADESHARAVQGAQQLARIGSDPAIAEIVALSIMPSRFHPRRAAADEMLAALAASRGLAVETLVARACPRAVVAEAENRLIGTQRRWLFDLMVHGRRLATADFLAHVAHHAIRGRLAAGLVWGHVMLERTRPFRLDVTARNAAVDRAGAPVVLDGGQVCVLHPLELAELAAWQGIMTAVEQTTSDALLVPPFEQLERPLFSFTDAEITAGIVERFARTKVGFHTIRDGLQRADWTAVVDHGVEAFARYYERGDVTIIARSPNGVVSELWAQRGRDPEPDPSRRFGLAKVHRIVASEALHDVARAVGATRPAPIPRAPTRSTPAPADGVVGLVQRGKYPFAELAKTSRSTCVICEAKIEKQTVRIGVERVIETPAFSGRATAWLHASCRDRCPELTDLTDLDGRLAANSAGVWPPG